MKAIVSETMLVGQVSWEKIPQMAKGFVVSIVLMSIIVGILYLAGADLVTS